MRIALKSLFSELAPKSVTIIQLGAKGDLKSSNTPLSPKETYGIGPIAELLRLGQEDKEGAQDYLHITLTDEEEVYDALGQLRPIFPNLMALDFENVRTGTAQAQIAAADELERKSPLELFASFYEMQHEQELSPEEIDVLEEIFTEAGVPNHETCEDCTGLWALCRRNGTPLTRLGSRAYF